MTSARALMIIETAEDLAIDFLHYDRKEDEDVPQRRKHRACRVFWHNVAICGALCAAYRLGRRSAGSLYG